jgi:transposase
MSNEVVEQELRFAAFAALDWADRKHVWALRPADSDGVEYGELENTPEAVETWAAGLAQRFGGPVAVALEQARGALLFMLTKYAHLVLFPVHPATLASYRAAFSPSGAKDDPTDAALLLDLLVHHRDRFRPWQSDTEETRTLQFLVEQRRRMVDEKTRQSNRLTEQLKLYFPQVLHWFDDVDSVLVGDLLQRWPTLEQLQKARPATLRQFFSQHNCRSAEIIEQRLEQIGKATPATRDQAVIQSSICGVQVLVRLIATLREGIAQMERRIADLFAQHPDFPLFHSLPGAGPALAPRLLAALGTRRERFHGAPQLHCYTGIAPVLRRSGNTQSVHFRWACPKFVRQTFHEWASHSIGSCQWAREYYQHQRAKNKSHHAAVRALAFQWIRILYRCWKDHTPYDEARYLQTLRRRHAPKPDPTQTLQWKSCGGFFKFVGASS